MGLFKATINKLRKGLAKTSTALVGGLRSILSGRTLSEELIDEIETHLITADVGVTTTTQIIDELRGAYRRKELASGDEAIDFLKTMLKQRWTAFDRSIAVAPSPPTVVLVAGVNGVGKTTSVAKIAKSLKDEGRTVLLAAADTFRAGAVEQLTIWSQRLDIDIIKGTAGADPAAVAFDAVDAALARRADVLLIDTAGRLHTQHNLMRQLTKIRDVVARKIPDAPHEVLLVLDATAGQNAVNQAREFTQAIDVTGIFLAKLDGTAKGGMVMSIGDTLGIPVKLVGVGETPDDVEPFDPDAFVDAMFQADAAS
jgi:fused signal recognition particle receptor